MLGDYTLTQTHTREANNSQLLLYLFIHSFIYGLQDDAVTSQNTGRQMSEIGE